MWKRMSAGSGSSDQSYPRYCRIRKLLLHSNSYGMAMNSPVVIHPLTMYRFLEDNPKQAECIGFLEDNPRLVHLLQKGEGYDQFIFRLTRYSWSKIYTSLVLHQQYYESNKVCFIDLLVSNDLSMQKTNGAAVYACKNQTILSLMYLILASFRIWPGSSRAFLIIIWRCPNLYVSCHAS